MANRIYFYLRVITMAQDFRARRIQLFPREAIFETIEGMAISKGMVNKRGEAMPQKIILDILETFCYNTLKENDRKRYREEFTKHKKK